MAERLQFDVVFNLTQAKKELDDLLAKSKNTKITPTIDSRTATTIGQKFGSNFSAAANTAINKSFSAIGTAVTRSLQAAVGTAFVGAGAVVRTGALFESELNNLSVLAGATGSQFDELTEKARDLGKTTVFSATQAAEGMSFLAKAGFDTNEILAATGDVLNLAAASGATLARSADIVSNVMGQFGIEAEDTNRAVDALVATFASSNTDIFQLSESLKFLGPTAKSLGVELEETAAVIGFLGNAGIQGSLAGRAFGTSLTRLANPSEKMAAIMSDLNLEFFDAEGNFIGITDTIGVLEKGFAGLTQEQRAAAISTLFGAEAYQEVNILLEEGSDALRQYEQDLTNTNRAAEVAAAQTQGLLGQFKLFKSVLEDQFLTIFNDIDFGGSSLSELSTNFLKDITDGLASVDLQSIANGITTAFQTLSPILSDIGKAFASVFNLLRDNRGLATAFGVAVAALVVFFAPVTAIFAAVGAAAVILARNWGKVTDAFDSFRKSKIGQFIKRSLIQVFDDLGDAFNDTRDQLKPLLEALDPDFYNGVKLIIGIVGGALFATFLGLVKIFEGVVRAIGQVATFFVNTANSINESNAKMDRQLQSFRASAASVFNSIISSVSSFFNFFSELPSKVAVAIASAILRFNEFRDSVSFITSGISSNISNTFTNTKNNLLGIFSGIGNTIGNYFNSAVGIVSGVVSSIRNTFSDMYYFIINNVINPIGNSWGNIVGNVVGIVDSIRYQFSRLTGVFSVAQDAVVGGVRNFVNSVVGSFNSVINAINGVVTRIPGVSSGIPTLQYFARGGLVGDGRPATGAVPAVLNDGRGRLAGQEYVVNAPATRQFLPLLEAMNNIGLGRGDTNNTTTVNKNTGNQYNNYGSTFGYDYPYLYQNSY